MAQYRTAMQVYPILVSGEAAPGSKGTYDTQGTNKDIRWRIVVRHHFRDEICGHSDYAEKGHGLKYSADLESRSKGAMVGSVHIW